MATATAGHEIASRRVLSRRPGASIRRRLVFDSQQRGDGGRGGEGRLLLLLAGG